MAKISSQQEELPLFGKAVADTRVVRPPFDPKALAHLAAQGIFLGTSSWKYRGWEGMIYQGGYSSEAQFQRQSLREYTSYFPCVGADFTFYTWPNAEMMSYLLDSTPENFRFCPKVTKRITMAEFPAHSSYGQWAGKKNPEFLNIEAFTNHFLAPISRIADRIGTLVFELTSLEEAHFPLLEKFFASIPHALPMSVEIRSPEILNADLYRRIRAWGVSPVFNSWSRMPLIREQMRLYTEAGGDKDTGLLCGRALLRPGRSYDDAVKLFHPYDCLQDEFSEGRDDLVRLMRFALDGDRKLFLLVNNRFEGSAPHTIGGIVERFQRR